LSILRWRIRTFDQGPAKRMCKRILFVTVALGQQPGPRKKNKPFVAKEYRAGKFRITKNDYVLGDITVGVIDVKNLGYVNPPITAGLWVDVLKGEQLVKRFYYDDVEPVGFSFGAFVPKQQPAPDYFMVVKEGDYDCRLVLVDKRGTAI
jgi:hypothetical protein